MTVLSALLKERAITGSDLMGRWGRGDDVGVAVTPSGVPVTRENAVQLSAVWACVSLISDVISLLPLGAFIKQDNTRLLLPNQPRWIDEPNPEQERHQWIGQQLVSLLFDGITYVHTIRDSRGDVLEAWVAPPWMVTPRRVRRGRIEYDVRDRETGVSVTLDQMEMFHISGMSWPGEMQGISPLEAARRIFGLGLGAQEFAERYYGQGFTANGIVETPEDLTPVERRELKQDFARMTGGLRKAHLPAVLTNGASYKTAAVTPEQAQFLESRAFSVTDIARFFRCPPHRIADVEKTTSWGSGVEEENIAFVMFTLATWIGRLEQGYSRRLMTFGRQARAFAKLNVDGLMRGRFKDRQEGFAIGVGNGWMCADDVNALEDRPPLPDGLGKKFYVPMNWRPVDEPFRPEPGPDETPADEETSPDA